MADPREVLRTWATHLTKVFARLPEAVFTDVAAAIVRDMPSVHEWLQRVFVRHAQVFYGQDVLGRPVHNLRVAPVQVADAFRVFLLRLVQQPEVQQATA
jgi:hypothetical protein